MSRQQLGGAGLDLLSLEEALDRIMEETRGPGVSLVVTPNVQHIALLETDQDFALAYDQASLTLADGWPVAMAARLLSGRRVERVTGADLLPAMLSRAEAEELSVAVVGGVPGSEEATRSALLERWPRLLLVDVHAPPMGLGVSGPAVDQLLARRSSSRCDVLLLFLGTPKQEVLAARAQSSLNAGVALCLGASLDFLTGQQRRAPLWLQRAGLEWAYRVAHHPRRLVGRYARAATPFVRVVRREWPSRQSPQF